MKNRLELMCNVLLGIFSEKLFSMAFSVGINQEKDSPVLYIKMQEVASPATRTMYSGTNATSPFLSLFDAWKAPSC